MLCWWCATMSYWAAVGLLGVLFSAALIARVRGGRGARLTLRRHAGQPVP